MAISNEQENTPPGTVTPLESPEFNHNNNKRPHPDSNHHLEHPSHTLPPLGPPTLMHEGVLEPVGVLPGMLPSVGDPQSQQQLVKRAEVPWKWEQQQQQQSSQHPPPTYTDLSVKVGAVREFDKMYGGKGFFVFRLRFGGAHISVLYG